MNNSITLSGFLDLPFSEALKFLTLSGIQIKTTKGAEVSTVILTYVSDKDSGSADSLF